MIQSQNIDRLVARFPFLATLPGQERARLTNVLHFPVLEAGQIAYEQEGACENYLMCIEGRTRITKVSAGGREMLLYKVQDGGTCVLTTQCLLSHTNFPAESVAETRTELAAVPAPWFYTFMAEMPAFRDFVIADYTKLLGVMLSFVVTSPLPRSSSASRGGFWPRPERLFWWARRISNWHQMSVASARSSLAILASGSGTAGCRMAAVRFGYWIGRRWRLVGHRKPAVLF